MINKLQDLYSNIGYRFNNADLLQQALTHKSSGKTHNERLEFLGDALINLIVSEILYLKFNALDEGKLTRGRSYLVKGDTLAQLANELNVGHFLLLGAGEEKSGGRVRKSILANALEALVGAIYLDSGNFETCKQVVSFWLSSRLENLNPGENLKDAKTILQEFTQAKGFALPEYSVLKVSTHDNLQLFSVQCLIKELNIMSKGEGKTRRLAEQQAANKLMHQIKE